MFELADKLVGIYKTFEITKTVTINPKALERQARLREQADQNGEQDNQRASSSEVVC